MKPINPIIIIGNIGPFPLIAISNSHTKIVNPVVIITLAVVFGEYVIVFQICFILFAIFFQTFNNHNEIFPVIDVFTNCLAFILFITVVIVITAQIYIIKYAVTAIEFIAL